MTSGASPGAVREVIRRDLLELLTKQVTGLAATISHLKGLPDDKATKVAQYIENSIVLMARNQPEAFQEKRQRAAERYCFIE